MTSNANLNDDDYNNDDSFYDVSSIIKDDQDNNNTTSDSTSDVDEGLLAEDKPQAELDICMNNNLNGTYHEICI